MIAAMFPQMLSTSQGLQVRQVIVQRIAVLVVNEMSPRHRAVHGFPDHYRAQPPHVWLRDLDPCPHRSVLVGPLSDRSHRELVGRPVARLELRVWRKAYPLGVGFTPRLLAEGAGARRGGILLTLRLKAASVEHAQAVLGAEACTGSARRFKGKRISALLARLFHPHILASGGLMTVPYCAVKMGRRGVGIELNTRYFLDGAAYVKTAADEVAAPTLFDLLSGEADDLGEAS